MTVFTRRQLSAALLAICALPAPGRAAPQRYQLDPGASRVGFTFRHSGAETQGTMPVSRADLRIDPDNLAASQVDVSVSVAKARTGLVFATQALKSADVLNAKAFPEVRFVSTSVTLSQNGRLSDGATISGRLSVRGVTRPLTLQADLYRASGSAASDLSRLVILLNGSLSRSAFGAAGYPDLVADRIDLNIRAAIRAV